ncbi:1,4-alpha-glucan branching protein GlgB [Qiania dongpingensis]|uniref:1,4-alpha-glucan branching enzyme GlgB n=1 Tax=Qiania dongpingensis TaxID=2763669 RepID=A0A7G9G6I6_9FIRM|nr:1,4-alpha-glucan branching protein GlgB [Qiania dongpingensis]QNM06418.1 1,4-alpha-glucan branching protein GlgB [Qiania dongpingensis]
MDELLYRLMDWPEIEAVVYSECQEPEGILGPHLTDDGILIQAFIPTAVSMEVTVRGNGKHYKMDKADEAGFFAVLVPGRKIPSYVFEVTYDNGTSQVLEDPYRFPSVYTEADLKRFASGIHYEIYEKMGAHPMVRDGVEGVLFSVWAPSAMRVSVVGDFNLWDGRRHQMQRLGDSGVYELFIPGIAAGEIYKYEVKFKGGNPCLKADPYANYAELRPATASIVYDLGKYEWGDGDWMADRKKAAKQGTLTAGPMNIYEVHLGSWKKREDSEDDQSNPFYNYREIAPELAAYAKEMGYTHVELMPVMEHPLDESWGYQVTGYYAPTSRYGTPDDFRFFIDTMHQAGIGVILDWVPAHFPRDTFGLADFDGTGLYEHKDPRKGAHPHWGTLIFNYGRPQVSNFLIANALYWAREYHADGIRMDAVASMLYLDYGKNDGEWIPNIYGGNENLEALEMLKHLNSIFKKKQVPTVLIAEESTAWPRITGDVEDGAVGFDYKWNMGWMNDFLGYMQCDPIYRTYHYGEMTFSLIYAYSERFILVLSHDEVVHGKGSMVGKMPGEAIESKFANVRAAYGFMMMHPGKKLLFMGQEFGQMDEWNESEGLQWYLLNYEIHKKLQAYVKDLNKLYLEHPAVYALDDDPDGFEWIDCTNSKENMAVFLRKGRKAEDTLLVVCNFAPVVHEAYQVGVPFPGKYKEILNSDALKYGGTGVVNPRVKQSKNVEHDERENSITIKAAPLGIQIFQYIPVLEQVKGNAAAKKKAKKSAGKTAGIEKIKKAMMEEA